MGLFGNKQEPAKQLSVPATVIFTCNSVPVHAKAVYWFEVSINDQPVGTADQNGVPLTFTVTSDKSVLALALYMKDISGKVTKYPGKKQKLELRDGETVSVIFENRRFIVGAGR